MDMQFRACKLCSGELRHLSSHQTAVVCRLRRHHDGTEAIPACQQVLKEVFPKPLPTETETRRGSNAHRRISGGSHRSVDEGLPKTCAPANSLSDALMPLQNLTLFETLIFHRPLFAPVGLCGDCVAPMSSSPHPESHSSDTELPYHRIGPVGKEVVYSAGVLPLPRDGCDIHGNMYVLMRPLTLVRSLGVAVGRDSAGIRVLYAGNPADEMLLLQHARTLKERASGCTKMEGKYFQEVVVPVDVVARLLDIDFSLGMTGARCLSSLVLPEKCGPSQVVPESTTAEFAEGVHSSSSSTMSNSAMALRRWSADVSTVPDDSSDAKPDLRAKLRREQHRTVCENRGVRRRLRECSQASGRGKARATQQRNSTIVESCLSDVEPREQPKQQLQVTENGGSETIELQDMRTRVPMTVPDSIFKQDESNTDDPKDRATSDESDEMRVKRQKTEDSHLSGRPIGSPHKPTPSIRQAIRKKQLSLLERYAAEAMQLGPHPPGVLWARTTFRWFVSFWSGHGKTRPHQKTFTVAKYGGVVSAHTAALKFHGETRRAGSDRPINIESVPSGKNEVENGRMSDEGDVYVELSCNKEINCTTRQEDAYLPDRIGGLDGTNSTAKREGIELPEELAGLPMPSGLTWSAKASALRACARGRVRWFGTRRRAVMEAYSRAVEWLEAGKVEGVDTSMDDSSVEKQGTEATGLDESLGQGSPMFRYPAKTFQCDIPEKAGDQSGIPDKAGDQSGIPDKAGDQSGIPDKAGERGSEAVKSV
eukprot:GHVS01040146.1.p1 GENE.GHVS01040146.1~~GHVS01040146.1.p1  ORF type:complete len:764 (+),score=64.68 GHVS01040146.1:296-2587(+)